MIRSDIWNYFHAFLSGLKVAWEWTYSLKMIEPAQKNGHTNNTLLHVKKNMPPTKVCWCMVHTRIANEKLRLWVYGYSHAMSAQTANRYIYWTEIWISMANILYSTLLWNIKLGTSALQVGDFNTTKNTSNKIVFAPFKTPLTIFKSVPQFSTQKIILIRKQISGIVTRKLVTRLWEPRGLLYESRVEWLGGEYHSASVLFGGFVRLK